MQSLYARPHLPQGAPTSPSLANWCAFHFDARVTGLVRVAGVRYTRYADDLLFSSDHSFTRAARRFAVQVAAMAGEEGFRVNFHKTRSMPRSQRQIAAGIVLNGGLSFPRDHYDRLRALLFNCARHGPASQNRENHAEFRAHLQGRIAHVAMIQPARGERLRKLFATIVWE